MPLREVQDQLMAVLRDAFATERNGDHSDPRPLSRANARWLTCPSRGT